jgi:hypothetical protein
MTRDQWLLKVRERKAEARMQFSQATTRAVSCWMIKILGMNTTFRTPWERELVWELVCVHTELETANAAQDFVQILPAEITAQILSYLDHQSLVSCEAVSRRWREAATNRHVWRDVFRTRHGPWESTPGKDWRTMFVINKELHRRWNKAEMSYKYMSGHTDSVYCVQFDEYVGRPLVGSIANPTLGRRSSRDPGIGRFEYGISRPVNVREFSLRTVYVVPQLGRTALSVPAAVLSLHRSFIRHLCSAFSLMTISW